MQCSMDHIVLNVEDVESMMTFYTQVLMLEPERWEEYNEGNVLFPSVRLNANTIIDLFPKPMWQANALTLPDFNRLNHFCLSVEKEDWEDLFERLKANNIAIEDGPAERWGALGNGTSIYFKDPEGNVIEARYYQ